MADAKWQKVREIFDAAQCRTPEERQKFVFEACGEDKSLRAEVESLLSSLGSAESFMETPAVAEVADVIEIKKLEAGECFGHYGIIKQIGAGGMGEVYLAHDTQLRRLVALKLLPGDYTQDKERLHRFEREAHTASALNHPNILTIYEIGEANGSRFIASEFVKGETLRERLKRAKLTLPETLDIAAQIAAALNAAHEAKIVHRDIKPENVMLREDGLVKVLDFGLAKLSESKSETLLDAEAPTLAQVNTAAGVILGTAAYMSPEQARGQAVDARTDLWSLGVVLYEMLSGRQPFTEGTASDTIASILKTEIPSNEFSSEIPSELKRIVLKTLRKDREERYQTAKDLLIDLRQLKKHLEFEFQLEHTTQPDDLSAKTQILNAAPTDVPLGNSSAEDVGQKAASNVHRSFALKLLALLGVLALVATGVWFIRARHESFANINVQKVAQITSWSGLDDFPALSPDGNTVAYCSDRNGSFEIYVKQLTTGAREVQLTSDGAQNFQPAWSPDGQRIAYYSKQRGGIWIIPASGGEAKQITDFGSHPAWSPDGKQIAFQSYPLNDLGAYARNALPPSTLWLVAAEGGEPKQLTQLGNPAGGHGAPSFSPDGKRIVFEVDDFNSASVWTISTGGDDIKRISQSARNGNYEPVYAPDGKSILYASGGVFQARVDSDTGEALGEPSQIASIGALPSAIRRVSFSADGKRMAYSVLTRRESLSSVRLQLNSADSGGARAPLVQNTNARSNFPTFSPDGKRIAFTSCNIGGTGCDIWLMNADGSDQVQLTTNEGDELMPSWFPDTEQVAYVSNRTGHWTLWAINLNTKREKLLLDLKDNLELSRLSPDGKQVVFNLKKDGVINVWTASLAGGEPKQLTFDKEQMGFPAWSRDGKYIAFQMKRGDSTHIMVMPGEGGTPVQLTFDKGQSWIYDWSPDGDKILFAGFRDGLWNVRWVSRSTKEQKQLTNYTKLNSFVRYPAWSPKGDQIVYEYSETTGNIWVADLK